MSYFDNYDGLDVPEELIGELKSPEDFGEVMEAARMASKKSGIKVEDLVVGTDWGTITFFKPKK